MAAPLAPSPAPSRLALCLAPYLALLAALAPQRCAAWRTPGWHTGPACLPRRLHRLLPTCAHLLLAQATTDGGQGGSAEGDSTPFQLTADASDNCGFPRGSGAAGKQPPLTSGLGNLTAAAFSGVWQDQGAALFPFMARIRGPYGECSGALVAPGYVLTTARCMYQVGSGWGACGGGGCPAVSAGACTTAHRCVPPCTCAWDAQGQKAAPEQLNVTVGGQAVDVNEVLVRTGAGGHLSDRPPPPTARRPAVPCSRPALAAA